MQRTSLRPKKLSLFILIAAMICQSSFGFAQGKVAQRQRRVTTPTAVKRLSEQQRVNHLLNRIAFGARPGEAERVMKMGWQNYLDQQMHPESIADATVEEKLKAFPELQ